jgi:hypothetical protein
MVAYCLVLFVYCLPVACLLPIALWARDVGDAVPYRIVDGQLLLVPQNRGKLARLYPGEFSPYPLCGLSS